MIVQVVENYHIAVCLFLITLDAVFNASLRPVNYENNLKRTNTIYTAGFCSIRYLFYTVQGSDFDFKCNGHCPARKGTARISPGQDESWTG